MTCPSFLSLTEKALSFYSDFSFNFYFLAFFMGIAW